MSRTVIVTGAAVNIGAAVATRLAAEGYSVAVNHRSQSSHDDAEHVVDTIRKAGGTAVAVEADVSDASEAERLVAVARSRFGPVYGVVNNAATSVAGSESWDVPDSSEWLRVFGTNVLGAVNCSRAAMDDMISAGAGSIVNFGSIRAQIGLAGNAPYTASKGALASLTRVMARELGKHGIRVNTLVIGAILTPLELNYGSQVEVDARVMAAQALGVRGTVDDVAWAVEYLISPRSSFVTGQSLVVDGGWTTS